MPPLQKPAGIALSFDDRFVKEWYQLRPLLLRYNANITFYITQPDSLSTEDVKLLRKLENDGHEIGCHGAMHVRSMFYLWNHSLDDYMKNEIFSAINTLKRQQFNPKTFAHPGGSQTWFSDQALLKHFTLLRDVSLKERNLWGYHYIRKVEEMDEIYYHHDNTRKVHALSIDKGTHLTIEDIRKGMLRAQRDGSVMMLFGHRPLTKTTHNAQEYGFDTEFLAEILAESAKLKLQFYTMSSLPPQSLP